MVSPGGALVLSFCKNCSSPLQRNPSWEKSVSWVLLSAIAEAKAGLVFVSSWTDNGSRFPLSVPSIDSPVPNVV